MPPKGRGKAKPKAEEEDSQGGGVHGGLKVANSLKVRIEIAPERSPKLIFLTALLFPDLCSPCSIFDLLIYVAPSHSLRETEQATRGEGENRRRGEVRCGGRRLL